MTMVRWLLVVMTLAVMTLGGCAGGDTMTTTPLVYLDADFGDDLPAVVEALHAWPGVEPRIAILPHADVVQLAGAQSSDASDNSVYVLAVQGIEQTECPWRHRDGVSAGLTTNAHNGSAVSCIAVDYVHAHPLAGGDAMRRAATHEFGHALGLRFAGSDPAHDSEAGHLMSDTYEGPDAPTADDLAALRARFP